MPRALDGVFQMDKVKLMKLITSGLVLAVVGLAIMIATNTIRTMATGSGPTNNALYNVLMTENNLNFWNNLYGYAEWAERSTSISQSVTWIVAACYLLKAIGQIALLFGMLLALIGLLGSAINPQNEDKMRLVCMITGCVIIFVMFMGMISV
jgi:hypothetical protein